VVTIWEKRKKNDFSLTEVKASLQEWKIREAQTPQDFVGLRSLAEKKERARRSPSKSPDDMEKSKSPVLSGSLPVPPRREAGGDLHQPTQLREDREPGSGDPATDDISEKRTRA